MLKYIYMIRHGEPEAGYTKRFLGRLDPGLSVAGVEQAQKIAARTATFSPQRCLASPLRRAAETALIVAAACGLEVETTDLLKEIDFGDLEGMSFAEASTRYAGEIDSWRALSCDFSFPGGEDFAAFDRRIGQLEAMVRSMPEERILLVAHGGILRGLLCRLLDVAADGPLRFRLAYASLAILEIDAAGTAVLTGFNIGKDA